MAGITPQISTSSFKPLSLQEIMIVPMAKQKMEDELLAGTEPFAGMSANVLGVDSEKASSIINDYKTRASALADKVLDQGVDRSQFNELRKLKGDVTNEQSSGFLGSAIANKKAASEYVNALATKKARQAGWSPAEAKQWAQSQVAQFAGTDAGDGTFNTFSGRELQTKVDEAEWIRKNIDDVAEQVSSSALRAVRVGGLPAFHRAFINQEVSSKDFNTIMRHLNTQARTDVDLQRSLQQSAAFTGEQNPLDFGEFKKETYTKPDGTQASREVWSVGKSRFGRRMAGMGDAADYRNVKVNHKIIKDDVGFALWKSGMEEKQAMKLIGYGNGEISDISRPDLSQLRTNVDLALKESDLMLGEVNSFKNTLLNNDPEYMGIKNQLGNAQDEATKNALQTKLTERESNVLTRNDRYMTLQSQYSKAATKWNNAKYAIESVYKNAERTLTPGQRKLTDMGKFVTDNVIGYDKDRIPALEKAIRSLPGGEDIIPENGLSSIGVSDDEMENFLTSKYLELSGYEVDKNSRANRSIFNWIGDKKLAYDSDILDRMRTGKRILEKKVESELTANPMAQSYTVLTAMDTGGLKSPAVAQNNRLLQKSMQSSPMQMAFGGGILDDSFAESQVGSSEKGYSYTPQMTDSWDINGNKIVNVVIKNLEKGTITTQPVINNGNSPNDIAAAQQMIRGGNPKQQRIGKKIIAGYKYMPNIKASHMDYQDKGEIGGLPFTDRSGNELKIMWEKSADGKYYTASINNKPLKNGQAIYGEEDMLNVIDDYVNAKYAASQKK